MHAQTNEAAPAGSGYCPSLVHHSCIIAATMTRARRAPASITLVLIGSAALTGCGDETARHDIYRSSVDCRQDWGDTSECTPVRSGPHVGYYYGPSYRDDRRNDAGTTTGPRQGSSAIATAHLARNDTSFMTSK